MDSYSVLFKASAKEEIWSVPFPHRRRLVNRISRLKQEPRPPDCEDLGGKGRYRIAQDGWGVAYAVDDLARIIRIFRIAR